MAENEQTPDQVTAITGDPTSTNRLFVGVGAVLRGITIANFLSWIKGEIKIDDLATPDDNTDLNATTSRHGLLPKLGGGTTNFLRADGTWAAPSGSGGISATSGDGAPSSTPSSVGDIYIDTTNDDAYIAVGTASSSDWEKSNDGVGSGGGAVTSGAGVPSSTPSSLGDIYIDTTNDDAYIAVGTASSSDWEKTNDGVGSSDGPTISYGAGVPISTPTKVGDIYVDTDNDDAYTAVGSASSADWEKHEQGIASLISASIAFGTDNVLLKSDGTGRGTQATGISVDDSNNVEGVNQLSAESVVIGTNQSKKLAGSSDKTDDYQLLAADDGAVQEFANTTDKTATLRAYTTGDNRSLAKFRKKGSGNLIVAASGSTKIGNATDTMITCTSSYGYLEIMLDEDADIMYINQLIGEWTGSAP